MKTVANSSKHWPAMLGKARALCKFFRNRSYRQHIASKLNNRVLGVKNPPRYFTATFAKWRYETLADVTRQLLRLRHLCEHELDPALFSAAQDPEFIREVFAACKDPFFWKWIKAAEKLLFRPIEELRRWGMVCDCPEHIEGRQNGAKHVKCQRMF